MRREIQRIVIVGPAETAAAACAFGISLRGSGLELVFVELPDEEPTAPFVLCRGGAHGFHRLLGLDEADILAKSGGSYLLGTRYRGFLESGRTVTVPLGGHGRSLRLVEFHHYVAKRRTAGEDLALNDFSLPAAAGKTGRFDPAAGFPAEVGQTVGYDLCLNRQGYAAYMQHLASRLGLSMVRGAVSAVNVADGLVSGLELEDGKILMGDLFVDCSRSRQVASRLGPGSAFRDWSQWLPCDRAARVSTGSNGSEELLATVEADELGWTNHIRVDDILVRTYAYASEYLDDEAARESLARHAGSPNPSDVAVERLRPGRQSEHWSGNCIALGSAAATLEPLDVSPMHLLQADVLRLLAMLPREKCSPCLAAEFNRTTNAALDDIRDYQALRYALAGRRDGQFWERIGMTEWPESLRRRIDLFSTHGRFTRGEPGLFDAANWVSSLVNFGAVARSWDPIADMIDADRMRADIDRFRAEVAAAAGRQPLSGPGKPPGP